MEHDLKWTDLNIRLLIEWALIGGVLFGGEMLGSDFRAGV